MVRPPLTYQGRLPGVVYREPPANPAADPLRLDTAAFVGFAARGPLNLPVLVEDISQYQTMFGGDLPLAREGSRPIYAHLPSAVRAFFDNGGERCYVVRVAGATATPNRFLLPGVVVQPEGGEPTLVDVPAAWAGRWSDVVQVGAQLRRMPLRFRDETLGSDTVSFTLDIPDEGTVVPGDLMRLTFAGGRSLLCEVTGADVLDTPAPTLHHISIIVAADVIDAFEPFVLGGDTLDTVERIDISGPEPLALTAAVEKNDELWLTFPKDAGIYVGDLLRLTVDDKAVFAPVTRVDWQYDEMTDEPMQRAVCSGPQVRIDPGTVDTSPVQIDRLTFDLYIREGERVQEIWRDLRFNTNASVESWLDVGARIPDSLSARPQDFETRSLRLGEISHVGRYLPLGMNETQPIFGRALPGGGDDDLVTFDPVGLFLDPQFMGVGPRQLMNLANEMVYLSDPAKKIVKLHSLIPLDDVGLVAVPDAVHRPWGPPAPILDETPDPEPPEPEEPPETLFAPCPPEEAPAPEETEFQPMEPWTFTPLGTAGPGFDLDALPVLEPERDYDANGLIDVQRALVELCAARADAIALLSLPEHMRVREARDWHQAFTRLTNFPEESTLSYAAAYHSWAQVREETTPELAPLRHVPPGGAVAGAIARREIARGPWVAPANEALSGVLGLTPGLKDEDWAALYNRQINVLRQQPGRFALMSAHTLAPNRQFLQISVRRLLIYIRKLALREGQRYVFETNNDRFRQLVQITFERALNRIVEAGGLVAFQVITGSEVNTQNDYDNGRFVVALKLAPSHPIEFITVVLVRSGENLLSIVER